MFSSAGKRVIGLNGVDRSNFDTKAYTAVPFCEAVEAQTRRILLSARFAQLLHCIVLHVLGTVLLSLTLNLLTTTIVAPPSNASKWQMGFNSAFKRVNKYLRRGS